MDETTVVIQDEPRRFARTIKKYSLEEKNALAILIEKHKNEFDAECERLKGKKHWDSKRKRHVESFPQQGYIAKAVREFYSDLKTAKNSDRDFDCAVKMAQRCFESLKRRQLEPDAGPAKKKFRQSGGGRKSKAPELRDELFQWFLDVRGALKGRLPKSMFVSKCHELYDV